MGIKLFVPGLFALLTVLIGMQQPLSACGQQHSESRSREHSSAATSQRSLEIVAGLLQGPGNPAVSKDGRIFITNHPFYAPEFNLIELINGSAVPYPNEEWSKPPVAPGAPGIYASIGLRVSKKGILWVADIGAPAQSIAPRLIGWDIKGNRLFKIIELPPDVTTATSFIQDFALDQKRNYAYIADLDLGGNEPAIIVVNLQTGQSRRVLAGVESTLPEDVPIVINGEVVDPNLPLIGLDGITIDVEYKWVYYCALQGTKLWRVRAKDLVNSSLTEQQLNEKVEFYAARPVCDGISIDRDNNIYITDLNNNAIGVIEAKTKTYSKIIEEIIYLSYPDGVCYGGDGYFYATVNQLQNSPPLNMGQDKSLKPYWLVRFEGFAESTIGR